MTRSPSSLAAIFTLLSLSAILVARHAPAECQCIDYGDYLHWVGSVETPGTAYGVAVSGTHAYLADQESGLQVIDITDPESPEIVGSVDTSGDANGVAVSGNYAYVAERESGLQVIDITNPATAWFFVDCPHGKASPPKCAHPPAVPWGRRNGMGIEEPTAADVSNFKLIERLGGQPPDTVYHYTDTIGLHGILTSGVLWATSMLHLNDSAEYRVALDQLPGALSLLGGSLDDQQKAFFENLCSKVHLIPQMRLGVVCFSAIADSLSQWRGYGGSHTGYCIGFHVPDLLPRIAQGAAYFFQCVYDEASQQRMLGDILAEAAEHQDIQRTFLHLALLSAAFKHASFSDEKEWRIVSSTLRPDKRKIGFRTRPTSLVPYCEIDLRANGKLTAIKSIMIGPTPHPDIAAHGLTILAESAGLSDVTIEISKSPYRSW